MTDPADRHLEERLHALASGVSVPLVPPDEDVRRGRRKLVRMRLAMAGATTATLAVVLGITSLTAGDPTASEVPPVTQPPSTALPARPDSSASEDGDADAGSGGNGADVERAASDTNTQTATDADTDADTSVGRLPRGNEPVSMGTTGSDATGSDTTGSDIAGVDIPGGTGHQPTRGPSSDPTVPTPTEPPTEPPTQTPTETPTEPPTSTPTVPPTQNGRVQVHRVLRYYNDVLAERLDPGRDHLQPYDSTIDPKQTTKIGGRLFALGSTYRWEAGRSLAGLQITVASGWDQVEWGCGASYSDWSCHASLAAGPAAPAEVAVHDGVRQVAVEHADGQVVVLTADPTSSGSPGVSVSRLGVTEDDLVVAAADEQLTLPGEAPVSPPVIDSTDFAAAGVSALMRTGESFDQTSLDRTPEVRGTWTVENAPRGALSWSAQPVYSGGGWVCLNAYRSCTDVTVDELGTTVHLAPLKKKAGGGWVIQYDGPSYSVRVYASDRRFPKKRAYAFVTDASWQPAR